MTRYVGLDPSTKTGLVILDACGKILQNKELTGVGISDPKRMVALIDEVVSYMYPFDVICIEGFAFGAQGKGVAFQYGLGHGIRMALYRRDFPFIEVAPAAVKKFATGKGNTKKDEMVLPIFRKWNFEHPSDNVRDAYVLAQIAMAIKNPAAYEPTKYQAEVIEAIVNPVAKEPKRKGKVV